MRKFSLLSAFIIVSAVVFAANSRDIHLATFNICVPSSYDADRGNGWEIRREFVCDLIGFEDFDIIGMQEATYEQINQMLELLPQYVFAGEGRNGAFDGEFCPIFYNRYRFRLLKSGTFWLSETPDSVSYGWGAECRRVCTYVQLYDRRTGKRIWHFNTHLDHASDVARNAGVRLILARIAQLAGNSARVILTGDFNARPTTECYTIAQDSGRLIDSRTMAQFKYEPSISTYNGFDPATDTETYIDYIFVRPDAIVHSWGIHSMIYWDKGVPRFPSDHYPVSAVIKY